MYDTISPPVLFFQKKPAFLNSLSCNLIDKNPAHALIPLPKEAKAVSLFVTEISPKRTRLNWQDAIHWAC
jgi:hypothetical protein